MAYNTGKKADGRSSASWSPRTCFYCGESGHIKANCPKKKQDSIASVVCYKCGVTGHIQRNCPQSAVAHKAPSQLKESHDKKEEQYEGLVGTVSQLAVGVNGKPKVRASQPTHMGASSFGFADEHQRTTFDSTSTPKKPSVKFPSFIDTHCHLEYVFSRHHHQGSFESFRKVHKYPDNFEGCISTFCDPAAFSSFGIWQDLLKDEKVWGTFGIHPHNAKYYYSSGLELEDKILKCLEHPKCVAYGEIGLDYADHSPSDQQTQREVLIHQLQVAVPFSKPLLFHCRGADDELLRIVSEYVPREWKIHLHCYTGSESTALQFIEMFPNLYIGVCGNVTYRKYTNLRQVVCSLPIEKVVIETDAPYNTPSNMPRDCRFSHPAHAFYVAKEIAYLKKMDVSEVLAAVRENTKSLYGL